VEANQIAVRSAHIIIASQLLDALPAKHGKTGPAWGVRYGSLLPRKSSSASRLHWDQAALRERSMVVERRWPFNSASPRPIPETLDGRWTYVAHQDWGHTPGAGQTAGDPTAFKTSLAIRECLATTNPANAGWQLDRSVSQTQIGVVLRAV
jgi:hypothetical protein